MDVSESIKYIGVNDHKIDLFEGQFAVPLGMAYNSYVIMDEKIAVMDSVDEDFGDQWLKNLKEALGSKKPDYLVVQHMEMDHSANIMWFMETFPDAKIVASKMAFTMMKSYFGTDFADRQVLAAEGTSVSLGKHTLNFIAAPNVHWPEVIMTYESFEKALFTAEAFGKFGANDVEDPEGWDCEARRYYFGIVGKFGANVQAVLKKISAFEVGVICPLHGPVLSENLSHYLDLYNIWSSYGVESEGAVIAYTSVYGDTAVAAQKLAQSLIDKGLPKVSVCDLAREDFHECIEDAFRYGTLVLATTTYNGGIFPKMKEFIENLIERNYQNRRIAFIENGAWAPAAAKQMQALLEGCKNITFAQNKVTIKIAVNDDVNAQMEKLADELTK